MLDLHLKMPMDIEFLNYVLITYYTWQVKTKPNLYYWLLICGHSSFYQSFALLHKIIKVDIAVMGKRCPWILVCHVKSTGKFYSIVSVLPRPSHFQNISPSLSFSYLWNTVQYFYHDILAFMICFLPAAFTDFCLASIYPSTHSYCSWYKDHCLLPRYTMRFYASLLSQVMIPLTQMIFPPISIW